MQSLDGTGGFQDSSVDSNFGACERSMKQVVFVFKHLGKVWKVSIFRGMLLFGQEIGLYEELMVVLAVVSID